MRFICLDNIFDRISLLIGFWCCFKIGMCICIKEEETLFNCSNVCVQIMELINIAEYNLKIDKLHGIQCQDLIEIRTKYLQQKGNLQNTNSPIKSLNPCIIIEHKSFPTQYTLTNTNCIEEKDSTLLTTKLFHKLTLN